MSQTRIIGRVLSVDNYRVFIKIDDEIKGSYKNGVHDVYEIARINSYLIIPVGSDRIVALITRVSMKEELPFDQHTSAVILPTSSRYISATMLGTIIQADGTESFIQGVYSFPALDNPVWYVTKKDLDHIFDNKCETIINYEKDYYLPIGTSPAFQGYKVKICPDQFFVKHAAILGNTGSGKSCTLTSILRSLFRFEFDNKKTLKNAHIIIFDTNGEYKEAFCPHRLNTELAKPSELAAINAFYYGGDGEVKIPYWLMNWQDFKSFLKPGDGVQAPILNRAIGLARNREESSSKKILSRKQEMDLVAILESSTEDLKKRTGESKFGNWIYKEDNEIEKIGEDIKTINDELGNAIICLASSENFNNAFLQNPVIKRIEQLYHKLILEEDESSIINEQNIDLPLWFSYRQLCTLFIDEAISQERTSNGKINEFVSTLRLRMNSFLNDKRMANPLMLKNDDEINKNVLPQFISLLFGEYCKVFYREDSENYIKNYCLENSVEGETTNQITIVDMSQLPYEVLETITGILGRIILEFVSFFLPENRGSHPFVIVLEEAQNYIAENKESVSKTVFERIAREGRKYGVSLVVSSQRPSELSKTVLSQCNSFVIHRLQNPDDQKYIRGLVSSANADLLDQLPIIPQQHALVTGDCVRTPVLVRIDDVYPTPNSHNPKFIKNWLNDDCIDYEGTINRWVGDEK